MTGDSSFAGRYAAYPHEPQSAATAAALAAAAAAAAALHLLI